MKTNPKFRFSGWEVWLTLFIVALGVFLTWFFRLG